MPIGREVTLHWNWRSLWLLTINDDYLLKLCAAGVYPFDLCGQGLAITWDFVTALPDHFAIFLRHRYQNMWTHPSADPDDTRSFGNGVLSIVLVYNHGARKMIKDIKSFKLCVIIGPHRDLPYLKIIAITMPNRKTKMTFSTLSKWSEIQPGRWILKKRTEDKRLAIQNPYRSANFCNIKPR